ncbi:protein-glutamate O-methyltransferase CheR [Alicyclobacillaceae bacterium I2511]|nr:protein-glutamate O-methyltransferase CheR [Alicyclobacillaceae bacterium I2511]
MGMEFLAPDAEYDKLAAGILRLTGVDLGAYKQQQMRRRLQAYLSGKGFSSYEHLLQTLQRNPEDVKKLVDYIGINVTEFFRDTKPWQTLKIHILPELLQRSETLSIWSAACATGQEPYSIALTCSELSGLHRVHILATDVDEGALAVAVAAHYTERAVQGIPVELLHRYFSLVGESYVLTTRLRRAIQFMRHNLLADPYPVEVDLIVCRNVLIYLKDVAKDRIIAGFAASLKPGGYLFLGGTEHLDQPRRYGLERSEIHFYRRV